MDMKAKLLVLSLFVFTLPACGTTVGYGKREGNPIMVPLYKDKGVYAGKIDSEILTRLGEYYKEPQPLPEGIPSEIKTRCSVDLTTSHVEELIGKNAFLELDPKTQAALIEYASKKGKPEEAQEALKGMMGAIGKEEKEETKWELHNSSHGRNPRVPLTLSCTLIPSGPADRLERVYAFLILDPTNTVAINRVLELKSERETVRYGTLMTTLNLAGTVGASGVPLPQAGGTGQLQFNPSYQRQLTREIIREMIPRTFHEIDDKTLEIALEGEYSVNVSGNTFLTIELSVPHEIDYYLFEVKKETGEFVSYHKDWEPGQLNRHVKAKLFWVAEVRQVESGDSTVQEDDDRYYSVRFGGLKDINLWKDDVVTYYLCVGEKGKQLYFRDTKGNIGANAIYFKSIDDAHMFRRYLIDKMQAPSNSPFSLGGTGVEVGLYDTANNTLKPFDPDKLDIWPHPGQK